MTYLLNNGRARPIDIFLPWATKGKGRGGSAVAPPRRRAEGGEHCTGTAEQKTADTADQTEDGECQVRRFSKFRPANKFRFLMLPVFFKNNLKILFIAFFHEQKSGKVHYCGNSGRHQLL